MLIRKRQHKDLEGNVKDRKILNNLLIQKEFDAKLAMVISESYDHGLATNAQRNNQYLSKIG